MRAIFVSLLKHFKYLSWFDPAKLAASKTGELRRALDLTQEQVAGSLNMNQAAISKFEHQSDIYIGTLRKILSAMGAELKIIAHFPDTDVVINQFTDF